MVMGKKYVETLIVIVGKTDDKYRSLIHLIQEEGYKGITIESIQALKSYLSKEKCMAVLIDIDTVPIKNRKVRELTVQFSQIPFMCMSEDKYHPELKETICYHIYACINKSIDPDELFYLLRSIRDDNQ
jgi:DNA-binding NtrC family response regulator